MIDQRLYIFPRISALFVLLGVVVCQWCAWSVLQDAELYARPANYLSLLTRNLRIIRTHKCITMIKWNGRTWWTRIIDFVETLLVLTDYIIVVCVLQASSFSGQSIYRVYNNTIHVWLFVLHFCLSDREKGSVLLRVCPPNMCQSWVTCSCPSLLYKIIFFSYIIVMTTPDSIYFFL